MSDKVHEGHDHEGGHEEVGDHEPHEPAAEAEDHVVPEPQHEEVTKVEPEVVKRNSGNVAGFLRSIPPVNFDKIASYSVLTLGAGVVVGMVVSGAWIPLAVIATPGVLVGGGVYALKKFRNR